MTKFMVALGLLFIGSGAFALETFSGVGIVLIQKDGLTHVEATLSGSPAESAGIQSQEIINAVDGQSIVGADLAKVVSTIRGLVGSPVVLTIADPQNLHEREVSMIRVQFVLDCYMEGTIQLMANASVNPTMISGNIGIDPVSWPMNGSNIFASFKGETLNLIYNGTGNSGSISGWIHGNYIQWTGVGNRFAGYQACIP